MRNFWTMIFAGVMLLAAPSVGTARAQSSTNINDQVPIPPSGARGLTVQNAMFAHQQEKLAEKAEAERRKQVSDETAKLLQLATELKAAVDKSNKNQMSLEVIRKADEVEKLAHDIKLKMRS